MTGISRTAELMELLEQAIVLCRQVFEQISLSASCEISNLPIALEPFGGVSLNYGLKNATHNDAKFYQPIEAL